MFAQPYPRERGIDRAKFATHVIGCIRLRIERIEVRGTTGQEQHDAVFRLAEAGKS